MNQGLKENYFKDQILDTLDVRDWSRIVIIFQLEIG